MEGKCTGWSLPFLIFLQAGIAWDILATWQPPAALEPRPAVAIGMESSDEKGPALLDRGMFCVVVDGAGIVNRRMFGDALRLTFSSGISASPTGGMVFGQSTSSWRRRRTPL